MTNNELLEKAIVFYLQFFLVKLLEFKRAPV